MTIDSSEVESRLDFVSEVPSMLISSELRVDVGLSYSSSDVSESSKKILKTGNLKHFMVYFVS